MTVLSLAYRRNTLYCLCRLGKYLTCVIQVVLGTLVITDVPNDRLYDRLVQQL